MGSKASKTSKEDGDSPNTPEVDGARTEILTPSETYPFKWTIANFKEILQAADKEAVTLHRVTFEMGHSVGFPLVWRCQLQMGEFSSQPYLIFALYLEKMPENVSTSRVVLTGQVIVGQEQFNYSTDFAVDRIRLGYCAEARKYLAPWRLPPSVDYFKLEQDGSLCIHLWINVVNKGAAVLKLERTPARSKLLPSYVSEFEGRFLQKLQEDLGALYQNPCNCSAGDGNEAVVAPPAVVKLISQDGREFSVNWFVLAARSPVFRAMFRTPMIEVMDGVVRIEDVAGDALEVFLHFLHTAKLKTEWKDEGILEGLAYAAHKYMMPDLLEFLDKTLVMVVTPMNGETLLSLAGKLGLDNTVRELLPQVRSFIAKPERWCQEVSFRDPVSRAPHVRRRICWMNRQWARGIKKDKVLVL